MPRLKVSQAGSECTEYEFGNDDVTIGREIDNAIVLDDPSVSRHHAVLQFSKGEWWLRDLGSAHGILHAGGKVAELHLVDRISFEIGSGKFRFMQGARAAGEGGGPKMKADGADAASSLPEAGKTAGARGNSSSVKKGKGKGKSKQVKPHAPLLSDEKAEHAVASPMPAQTPEPAVEISKAGTLDRAFPALEERVSAGAEVQALPAASDKPLPEAQMTPIQKTDQVALQLAIQKFRRAKWFAFAALVAGMMIVGWLWTASNESREPNAVTSQPQRLEPSPKAQTVILSPKDSSELYAKNQAAKLDAEITLKPQAPDVPHKEPPPAAASMPALVREPPSTTPLGVPALPESVDQIGQKATLYQRETDSADTAPVLSPRLDRVLHLKKRSDAKDDGMVDVWLNDQRVAEGLKVSSEGDLLFSVDGASWLVQANKPSGERWFIRPGQKSALNSDLQSFQFSRDMAVIATITRSADQDHLSINGTVQASYHHLRDLRLSADGKHWACIAAKSDLDTTTGESAGERVIADSWQSGIFDQIRELTLSEVGGRVAFIGQHHTGWQRIHVGDALVYEVFPGDHAAVTGLTFSPDGKRLAWVVIPERGMPVFHLEGSLPIRAEVSHKGQSGTLLSPTLSPAVRIVFSQDSQHVAYAAAHQSAIVIRDRAVVGYYPALQMDSLVFSPDGTHLAFVTRHPLGEVTQGAAGVQSQQHTAVLNLDGVALEQAPTQVHKMASRLPITVGGISRLRFSMDSKAVAALHTPPSQGGAFIPSIHVNGQDCWHDDEAVQAFEWLDAQKLVVVCSNHPEDQLNRIVVQWIKRGE